MALPERVDGDGSPWSVIKHGVIGGLLGALVFFIPFSTILGGAIAGYLEGATSQRAGRAGIIAGGIMFIPTAGVVTLIGSTTFVSPLGGGVTTGSTLAAGGLLIILLGVNLALGYAGGLLGAYIDQRAATAGTDQPQGDETTTGEVILYGVIGGLASVVLSFIPYSTVLGGVIAGYLAGGSIKQGIVSGGIAGGLAFIPLVVVTLVLATIFGLLGGLPGAVLGVVVLFIVVGILAYTIGLGIIGGVAGNYLKREHGGDIDSDATRGR